MRTGILLLFGLALTTAEPVFAARADHILIDTQSRALMRCEAPVEFSDRYAYLGTNIPVSTGSSNDLLLTLLRKADNQYDVLAGPDSMAATGRLLQAAAGDNPVHLIYNTNSGPEHFLFVQNPDGTAELLWSSATASALTRCSAVN